MNKLENKILARAKKLKKQITKYELLKWNIHINGPMDGLHVYNPVFSEEFNEMISWLFDYKLDPRRIQRVKWGINEDRTVFRIQFQKDWIDIKLTRPGEYFPPFNGEKWIDHKGYVCEHPFAKAKEE